MSFVSGKQNSKNQRTEEPNPRAESSLIADCKMGRKAGVNSGENRPEFRNKLA
jgi:hypothetical protein